MMPKNLGWRIVWLTWVAGFAVAAAAALILFALPKRGCPIVTPRLRTDAFMHGLASEIQVYRMRNDDQWPSEEPARLAHLLAGAGSRHHQLIQFAAGNLNGKGEPIDAWGTALRFEFSSVRLHIVSAGQDRTFGTPDDLTFEQ